MKNLRERIADLSQYLQCLTDSAAFPEVQNAVEKKDKDSLVEVCRKMKIPEVYIGAVVSVLLSIHSRQPKWPWPW